MIFLQEIDQPLRVLIENEETLVDWIQNPSSIVALLAIIISIFGVCITIRQHKKTLRKAEILNEKSVEPELSIFNSNRLSKEDSTVLNSKSILKNCGLGPARIISIDFLYSDTHFSDFNKILEQKHSFLYERLIHELSHYMTELANTTMAPNDELVIFDYYLKFGDEHKETLFSILQNTTIHIIYISMFDKEKVFESTLLNNPIIPIN